MSPDAAKTLFPQPRSSLAILRGGYNLDSFMVRYQGVDWTNEANWECNARCCLCPRVACGFGDDLPCLQSRCIRACPRPKRAADYNRVPPGSTQPCRAECRALHRLRVISP